MPFTLSHAAAALPFRRTRLVMSAVVVGCFAPDFEYFSPLGHHGSFGHTLTGMFVLDLPLGLAVLWLFHRYVREPLTACLPEGARERLDRTPDTFAMNSFSRFAMIAFSILVGIATATAVFAQEGAPAPQPPHMQGMMGDQGDMMKMMGR